MPTIASFHGKYWRARANGIVAPGAADPWQYPAWQTSVTMSLSLVAGFVEALTVIWARVRWCWRIMRRLRLDRLTVDQFEWYWRVTQRFQLNTLTVEQFAVLDRAIALMQGPRWGDAQALVRQCATSPGFHRPEAWVEYSRAGKASTGQAQNIFRHVKVVHALTKAYPELTNPAAHLLAELGYHAFAGIDRRERQIVDHPKQFVEHAKTHVTHERLVV